MSSLGLLFGMKKMIANSWVYDVIAVFLLFKKRKQISKTPALILPLCDLRKIVFL